MLLLTMSVLLFIIFAAGLFISIRTYGDHHNVVSVNLGELGKIDMPGSWDVEKALMVPVSRTERALTASRP